MPAVATQLTAIAAIAVLIVLILGLWNMTRRQSNPNLSQTLMRWRVGLQFIAIVLAMIALYIAQKSG